MRKPGVARPEVAGMSADAEREALERAVPPVWASAWGEDAEFGVFAVLRIGAAEQHFRWIAPGPFMMGAGEDDGEAYEDERPQQRVSITRGFWLADTPCTQAMWMAVMADNPSHFKGPMRPVERVSAKDVDAFMARLAQHGDFRLPSEAEWEYACRAGTETSRYDRLDDIAWYSDNSDGETHDVAAKRRNSWGLYDMLGNVWEWVENNYGHGTSRAARGGCHASLAHGVRASCRGFDEPVVRDDRLGFRLLVGLRQESAERPIGSIAKSRGGK